MRHSQPGCTDKKNPIFWLSTQQIGLLEVEPVGFYFYDPDKSLSSSTGLKDNPAMVELYEVKITFTIKNMLVAMCTRNQ